jgi:D-beta-D-heptose 7-phosphate kinase/D-beta-D-heptose 1-phosphate adenosyltransferase
VSSIYKLLHSILHGKVFMQKVGLRSNMKEIINYLKTCHKRDVLVIGDVMLDEYLFGRVDRISSEAPIPVVREQSYEHCLGGAGNTALNCSEIGLNTTLLSMIGIGDFAGQKILSLLKNSNMPINGIVESSERQTTLKKRVVVKNQQLICIDSEFTDPLSKNELNATIERFDKLLQPGMTVLISDYDRGFITPELLEYVIFKAKSLDCLILVDPSGPDYLKYKGVNYIKPNAKEFSEMISAFGLNESDDIELNAKNICTLLDLDGIFVTLGEKGIKFISTDKIISIPTQAKEIYGVVGAGDTVFAFIALGLSSNLSPEVYLNLANRAAAVAIAHVKTYAVGLDELVDRETEYTEKIFNDWATLKIELDWQSMRQASMGKKRVVFTNGCFDILHAGHVYLLKEAKKLGDILVVGLNSDASVRSLGKAPGRPINTLKDRAEVIAALGVVDFVVSFDQYTPEELLKYLKPDVFVKGGDYDADTMVGSEIVKNYGGVVKTIQYLSGFSTTQIVKKINENVI